MTATSYDELPYDTNVFPQTHPEQLAALAALFGLNPPETFRVLEIGCAEGLNITAIAQSLPQAECLGIDLSVKQIETAQQLVQTLNLTNIKFKQCDLIEIDDSFGKFDYIIAHGVYSWISKELQTQLLRVCRQNLTPNGIAYVSYNANPHWHFRKIIRDLMLYRTKSLPDVKSKVTEARKTFNLLQQFFQNQDHFFKPFLQQTAEELQANTDNYIAHDYLEAENHPVYFHEFVNHAEQQGLNYIADISFCYTNLLVYPTEMQDLFNQLSEGERVAKEQYIDFFTLQGFRRSLLCHQEQIINADVDKTVLNQLYLSAALPPMHSPDDTQFQQALAEATSGYLPIPENVKVQAPNEQIVTIEDTASKIAFTYLASIYPQRATFGQVCQTVYEQLSQDSTFNQPLVLLQSHLHQELFNLFCVNGIQLHTLPFQFASEISDMPTATSLARYQANQGQQKLTNLSCKSIEIDELCRLLIPHLDGQHSQEDLIHLFLQQVAQGELTVQIDETSSQLALTEAEKVQGIIKAAIDKSLNYLAKTGLLIA